MQIYFTNYTHRFGKHRFQQNRLIFLLGANRPGAKRLGGRNDLGRNAAGAKRLGGELDLGRNDPDSFQLGLYCLPNYAYLFRHSFLVSMG